MKYRRLGRTGLTVSVVSFGAWQFGGEWGRQFTQPEVNDLLSRAKAQGINLIDTAECYGDHLSEQLIGNFIKDRRDDWLIATKFGHKFTGHLERSQLWSVADVQQQLEDSLRALQTDVIDLYQFHSGTDAAFDNDELWTMLNKQVQAGKIRHLGLSVSSGFNPDYQIGRAVEVGAGAIQIVYNRLDRQPEATSLPLCQQHNLGVLARVPLASGFLSGKYKPGTEFTNETDVRATHNKTQVQARLQEVAQIQQNEVPAGVPMAAWALGWCLQHPAVTCVIPGSKTVAQVDSNASAANLDLVVKDHPQAVNR
ncbi:MAG: Aldo-keto reductase IolS [Anaerolineae bacterium]|nr:Aldo-keto reductase IolS [Anaerolineae bacterium]